MIFIIFPFCLYNKINFSSSNTRLISEQFTSTTEDVATVKLTYVTYLNKNNNSYAGNYIE